MARKPKTKPIARGQMQPFKPEMLGLIRAKLKAHGDLRQLALLGAAIDSCLRSGDLLQLSVADVTDHVGGVRERLTVMQGKTGRPIAVTLTPRTRETLAAYITASGKRSDDFLFTPASQPHARHITTAMLRRVVKSWCEIANLDPRQYSGHSLRRTKPCHVYQHTRNVAGVSRMLGHTSLAHTLGYLAISDNEVADLALRFDV